MRKFKKFIAAAAAAAILITGAVIYFMVWHNRKMAELQQKYERAERTAQEENERCKEVEAALDELSKKDKDLEDRIETIRSNRDAWKERSHKIENALNDLKEKYTVSDTVIDSEEIRHDIQKINELAVMEYKYRNTAMISDNRNFNISILDETAVPFTGKECIISMDGIIKVGIDANQVAVDTDESSKKIIVHLPAPKVLSNELDENSLFVYTEKDSIFNRLKAQDHSRLRQEIKDDAKELAEDNGILQQADERVKLLIQTMLEQIPDVKSRYTIEFKSVS